MVSLSSSCVDGVIGIITCSTEIQLMNECHGLQVMCRALMLDIYICFVVAVE